MSSRHNYARENTWEYWESLVRSCFVWRWKFTNRQLKLRANGRNIVGQQLPKLLDVTCCVRLHTLLHVVGCCCVLLHKVWNRSNFSANNSQHFLCSVIAEAWRNNVGSVCTALPTLLGPRMLITHGLQRLMGCILPTTQGRSQHCWELLHSFPHHCQHARNNSQHCWRNNVGSCCVRLHAALSKGVDCATHINRMWALFPLNMPWCYPTYLAKFLHSYRNDWSEVLGKTAAHECKKSISGGRTWVI